MDFNDMIEAHVNANAEISIATLPVNAKTLLIFYFENKRQTKLFLLSKSLFVIYF
jgi:ADP-glucose pyrophosphorylase